MACSGHLERRDDPSCSPNHTACSCEAGNAGANDGSCRIFAVCAAAFTSIVYAVHRELSHLGRYDLLAVRVTAALWRAFGSAFTTGATTQ